MNCPRCSSNKTNELFTLTGYSEPYYCHNCKKTFLSVQQIRAKLKRWAIAESDGHPYASKWVDYYDKLLSQMEAKDVRSNV